VHNAHFGSLNRNDLRPGLDGLKRLVALQRT
jgi:hypothetical protein